MQGTVKWFNSDKGFGFITSDSEDIFAHFSQIIPSEEDPNEYRTLHQGDAVLFDIGENDKGRSAINIRKILPKL